MVVTAISAAFGHARTASISRPMPCASFPWVYASLATWCTAPISRTILAVEALRLVKKDPPGARASRPHKAWHDRRATSVQAGSMKPCNGVAISWEAVCSLRVRARRSALAGGSPTWKTGQLKLEWMVETADDPRLWPCSDCVNLAAECLEPVSPMRSMLHWRLLAERLHRVRGPWSQWMHYGS